MPAEPMARPACTGASDGLERVARPADGFATRHLIEVLKLICRRELLACADEAGAHVEVVSAHIESSRAAPNAPLRMGGWVEQLSDNGACFRVRAEAAEGVVCEATLHLELRRPAAPADARQERIAAMTRELVRRFSGACRVAAA